MSDVAGTIVLMTPGDQRILVSTMKDELIYSAPSQPTGTGSRYTRGADLYRHRSRKGNIYYYLHKWSMWKSEGDSYELLDEIDTKRFIDEKLGGSSWVRPTDTEKERISQLFPELFEETG